MDSFKSDPNTFSCAVGYFSGISPLSVSITDVFSSSQLHLTETTLVVQYTLTFDIEPYSFASPRAAYETVSASLSNAVVAGSFTKLINEMSPVYAAVGSDAIISSPFSAIVTAQPSSSQQQLNANVAVTSSSTVDVTLWACVAAGVFVLIILIVGAIWRGSCRKRDNQNEKARALNDLDAFNITDGELQPVPGGHSNWKSVLHGVAEVDSSRNVGNAEQEYEAEEDIGRRNVISKSDQFTL